jgi:hypothetical protein
VSNRIASSSCFTSSSSSFVLFLFDEVFMSKEALPFSTKSLNGLIKRLTREVHAVL